jgi:HK97 family phage major capsid protein
MTEKSAPPYSVAPEGTPLMPDAIENTSMAEFANRLIEKRSELCEKREQLEHKANAILMVAKNQNQDTLSAEDDAEVGQYIAEMRQLGVDIEGLDKRIQEVGEEVRRSGEISKALAKVRHTERAMVSVKESMIYTRENRHQRSYINDLIRVSTPGGDTSGEAMRRLTNHSQDVATESAYAEYRDISRVDGQGGYAVPPAWLMDQYVTYARPGRAFANVCQRQTLPGGTDSINVPKMLTGTTVGVQTADNQTVSLTDLTDTFINAPVRTIAGQQNVAIQLIDQSPIAFDDVVFRDLTSAHAAVLDQQVIGGSGSNGQVLGVGNTPGITAIPSAGVTLANVYSAIANAIQTIHTTRFLPPEVIVMHPRRWGWLLAQFDQQQRPVVLPETNNPMNAVGILEAVDSQQIVGRMHGLPVVTDPNIATNSGAGTEDIVYVMRSSDLILWEGGIRARVLPETKAANLTVLLQIYNYLAFTAARYPASVVTITGLTAPTF